jgi:hypothetical protein
LGVRSHAGLLLFGFQAFVVDQTAIPTDTLNRQNTESVDFGDVDLDGDWDVGLAEALGANNRIWINHGGLQGGTVGLFLDETATRLPVLNDDSRDIEFVDIDGDTDVDWYTSNTSDLFSNGDRWWINTGGNQAGPLGYFVDETAARWVGLGSPPSSVSPASLFSGTFRDWVEDSDFGDLDNDGDLDLVHSSAGAQFGGVVPTRIFLNDGKGYFEEFNPSGFALAFDSINPGSPGLWCEGIYQPNTTDATGAFCDIASSALDIDLGDIDGDYDLDILHGALLEDPRLFANRSAGSLLAPSLGGGLGFRDVTTLAFPPAHAVGDGHYEQELGDLDGDADLDILGVNWNVYGFNIESVMLRNGGDGSFGESTGLLDVETDEHDGDFIDHDNDGDLDLYMSNFIGGPDRLYRNDALPGRAFQFTQVELPFMWFLSSDVDVCDADQDGDYDALVGKVLHQPDAFLRNVTQVPDTSAPSVTHPEAVSDRAAAAGILPVRTYVYDNAPDYLTWHNQTHLQLVVAGLLLPEIPARCSGGQVFRGELPANLVGTVFYRFASADEHGNTGVSVVQTYDASYAPTFQTSYGAGTTGAVGGEPLLEALSVPFADSTFYLGLSSSVSPGTQAIVAIASQPAAPGVDLPGLLLLNLAGTPLLVEPLNLGFNGGGVLALPLGPIPAGVHVYAQGFVLDPTAGGALLASSKGLELVAQ